MENLIEESFEAVLPIAKELDIERISYEVVRYSLIRGWLNKESIGEIVDNYNSLIDRRMSNMKKARPNHPLTL